jgi:EmrB/QacA subfamily drug resistance transporter
MSALSFFSEDDPHYPFVITTNVIVTTFLCVFSAVSTMIADPSIQGELALSDTQSIWLTTLYLLGINLTVPCGNWFANHFGFKRMYAYGVVIFTLGSLLAAVSENFLMIASARLIEGIGGGFIFPVGLALVVQSLPKSRVAFGINLYIAGAFGCGLGLGIPLAGYFSQFSSWRDIFFLIVPIGFLAAASCWMTRAKAPKLETTPFDFFGFITFACFISTFLIALTMGPITATAEGWRTPYILVFFFIAAVSLISCILIENHHPNPLFPPTLFKDPIFSVSLAAMFLLGMATFASVSIAIQYMLNGLFYEKFVTGKIAAVYGTAIGIFSILSSYLSKIIPIPILIFTGLFLLIFSYFYNNELSWLTGATQVIAILVIRGIGIGLSLAPTTLMALYGIPNELKTSAATVLTFFRQVGGTYGGTLIAIFSIRQTIFHTARFGEQANSQLPAYKMTFHNIYNKFPDPAQAKAAIVKNILTQAYIQGLNDALIVFGYVTSVVAIILMALIGYRSWKARLTH